MHFSPRLLLAALLVAACSSSTEPSRTSSTPTSARIITEDIPRFWVAFDKMTSLADTLPLRVEYLDRGTDGLKDFTTARWKNARTLASMIWPLRAYYASIRANTLSVQSLEPAIRRTFTALDTLLDDAIFPDVYFDIGGMGTGGTTSSHGLLIGTELFARAPDSPTSVLTPWQQSVTRSVDFLPVIVAHELTHYQQRYAAPTTTLLAQAIVEGSADFVGELLSGQTINAPIHAYGDAHEADVWRDFTTQMHGTDLSRWLYNGGSITSSTDRPADLGYYVGYRITAAYYAKQPDKRKALLGILRITDFDQFLAESGYSGS